MHQKSSRNRLCWAVFAVVLFAFGCDTKDADRLAQMGRRGAARLQSMTGDAREKLHNRVQSIRSSLDESGIEGRVASRLRWDKVLADVHLGVKHHGRGTVELTGIIQNEEQRSRAMGLALSTAGVEKAIDSMTRAIP